ncbi:MAG TPA: hypothetical protein VG963_01535 [Polyangiaceae bacterium]|nr:hypothetical protein [Polyangiaceae bacterium]
MPAEPSPESLASPSDVAAPAGGEKRTLPPETEEALDSPKRSTVGYLGVIFLATFLPWMAAKVGCNEHEGPIRGPLPLPTDVLSRQPKDAAIELAQRAATGEYAAAAELARGALHDELLAAEARCKSDPKECEARRARQSHVFTHGVLVRRDSRQALVRVESVGGPAPERYQLELEADAGHWFALSRVPFSGELTEPLAAAGETTPAQGASGAP